MIYSKKYLFLALLLQFTFKTSIGGITSVSKLKYKVHVREIQDNQIELSRQAIQLIRRALQ